MSEPIKPTPFELASLALELARMNRTYQACVPTEYFGRALELWIAAKKHLDAIVIPLPGREYREAEQKKNLTAHSKVS